MPSTRLTLLHSSLLLLALSACQPLATPSPPPPVTETAVPTQIAPAATPTDPPTPHPILSDLRVRQAIANCTDRAGLIRALLAGEVDVLDWETVGPNDIAEFALMEAQQAGTVRVIVEPSSTWELQEFALILSR